MQRLEDVCNSGPKGNCIGYTSGCVLFEEELLFHELGERVCAAVVEYAVDHWDALMDAHYAEYMAKEEERS